MRAAFTLIELLVVIIIIGLVSTAVILGAVWALGDHQLLASAQLLQGALVGARDAAIAANVPCGIRLLPSLANPDSLVQIMPLVTGARYTDGLVSTTPAPTSPGPLMLTGSLTNWGWNVRLGDRISWGGRPYTVCGPMTIANNDLFINYPPGQTTDYLQLTNGRDDDQNGFVDDGWDGVDNNNNGQVDEPAEWETETWTGPPVTNAPYILTRRPIPGNPQSIVALSVGVSLSASTLLVNPLSGMVDVMIRPDGTIDLSGPYAAPSAVGLGQAKTVFVLQDPAGNRRSITLWTKTGRIESQ